MKLVLINIDQTLNQLIKNQLMQLDPLNMIDKTYIVAANLEEKIFLGYSNDIIIINVTHNSELDPILKSLSSKHHFKNQLIIVGTDFSYSFVRHLFRLGVYDYWIKPFQTHLIYESLRLILSEVKLSPNVMQLKSNIVESIKGNKKLDRHDLEILYRHSLHTKKSNVSPIQMMNDFILELITPLSFSPILLPKANVAYLCATWILEQENQFEALVKTVVQIGVVYQELYYPSIHSPIVRNAIYEVLAPSIHQKTVKYISDKLYLNQSHLSTTFKKYTGISLSEYIKRVKLYGAMWMLSEQNYDLDDILDIIGYKDEQHFIRIFKEKTGFLPNTYQHLYKRYHLKK